MATFEPVTITAFFKEVGQMGPQDHTCRAIAAKGIATPDNLTEFTKNDLESMFHNLHKKFSHMLSLQSQR